MSPNTQSGFDWRPFGWSLPRLLLVGLVCSLCLIVLLVATTSTAGFSPYNPNWDGTGEFRQIAENSGELTVATETEQYRKIDPTTTTAFVFAPERSYTPADAETVTRFVENGGTLVVADNYGRHGNALLGDIGASTRFDGRIIRDEQNNFRTAALPIVTDVSNHRLVSDINALTLNYGTAVDPRTATPIVNSSDVSYLVQNQSDTLEEGTELQSYPVVTIESIGDGTVVTVGDPSIFINSMLDQSDNRVFASTLLQQRTTTLLDQSYTSSPPPLVAATLTLRSSPLASAGFVFTLIGLVIGGIQLYHREGTIPWRQGIKQFSPGSRSKYTGLDSDPTAEPQSLKVDPEALKQRLQNRHPDWDEDRIERVIAGVLSRHTNDSDNE